MRKIAICTIINDGFIKGGIALIKSFLNYNKWFCGDIIVFYSDNYCRLSNDSMNKLRKLYNNIIFSKVNESEYSKMIDHFRSCISQRLIPSAFTYEVFSVSGYDCVLYLDSDMIFINGIEEIFNRDNGIYLTNDGFKNVITEEYKGIKHNKEINGGFILLIGDNSSLKKNIIRFSEKYDTSKPDSRFYEQSCMNEFFKNKEVTILPTKYNMHKRFCKDSNYSLIDDLRIIHYCGRKPWNDNGDPGYSKIEKFWHEEFSR